MKLRIIGRTGVVKNHLEDDEQEVFDIEIYKTILSKNQVLVDAQDPDMLFQNFMDDGTENAQSVVNAITSGGWVSLELDENTNYLNIVTEYETNRELTKNEIEFVVSETVAQWSDGGGSALDHFSDEIAPFYVDPYPYFDDYDPDKPKVTTAE